MKSRLLIAFSAIFIILSSACGRSGPKPLTVEEIPPALSNAFGTASLMVKQNAQSIGKLVQDKLYIPATIQLQVLLPQQLTAEQRDVASAALATLNGILQQQAASVTESHSVPAKDFGPLVPVPPATREEAAAAAEVMNHYIRTK